MDCRLPFFREKPVQVKLRGIRMRSSIVDLDTAAGTTCGEEGEFIWN